MRRRVLYLALATTLCTSVALAEELFVTAPKVLIYSGKGAVYPTVATASKGTSLTVIDHEGKWIKVQAATTQGYVFEAAVSPQKPGGDLTAGVSLNTGVTEAAAGKGLNPDATNYAQGKDLSTKPLDDLIAFRMKIDPKEWQAFADAGKVGTSKP